MNAPTAIEVRGDRGSFRITRSMFWQMLDEHRDQEVKEAIDAAITAHPDLIVTQWHDPDTHDLIVEWEPRP